MRGARARRHAAARPSGGSLRTLVAASLLAVTLVSLCAASASASGAPLAALRAATARVSAGAKLTMASSSVLSQLSGNAYAWIPESSCLTTAIDSDDATPCVLGDTTAVRTVDLVGDSSADEWALDLGALGSQVGFRLVVYVHAACPVGELSVELEGQGVDPTCATFRNDVLADLARLRPLPSLVVLSELRLSNYVTPSGGKVTNAAWSKALDRTVTTIEDDGDAVVLFHGVSVASIDPAQCLAADPDDVTACDTKASARDPGSFDAATWAGAKDAKAAGVDVLPLFCTASSCPAVVDGEVTHSGVNHVTEGYAATVTAALGELLGCAGTERFRHASRATGLLDALSGPRSSALVTACRRLPS